MLVFYIFFKQACAGSLFSNGSPAFYFACTVLCFLFKLYAIRCNACTLIRLFAKSNLKNFSNHDLYTILSFRLPVYLVSLLNNLSIRIDETPYEITQENIYYWFLLVVLYGQIFRNYEKDIFFPYVY